MKRILVILMVLCMLLTCVACGEKADDNNDKNNNSTTESQTTNNDEDVTVNDTKITVEQLNNAPIASESDFVFTENTDGTYVMMEYNGADKLLKIPNEYQGKAVGSTLKYIFGNGCTVGAIKFPNGMTKLPDYVCALNKELQVVVVGVNTKEIGESAFQNCSALYEIVLNDGLETISTYAFAQCENLKSITIPNSVKFIDSLAFYGCPKDFVICGVSGSVAESFAQTAGIQFQAK